jgi:HD-GYP domain-containing protein (c-di-GMP phosphodiesterase class II)
MVAIDAERVGYDRRVLEGDPADPQLVTAAVSARGRLFRDHSHRVEAIAVSMALELGFVSGRRDKLAVAARLHDVGKAVVAEEVLLKPGPLSPAETAAMQRHPEAGERIVRALGHRDAATWIRHHHERWDGGGYPDGLSGHSIPLESRLLAVADSLDAMTSTRSYQRALDSAAAVAELRRCAGGQFDREMVLLVVGLIEDGAIRLEACEQLDIDAEEALTHRQPATASA